jgi:hypothetical protein
MSATAAPALATSPRRRLARKAAQIVLAVALIAFTVFEAIEHGLWTPALAGLIGPDVALLAGAGRGLARGQLHPRAVGFYNALHRWWPPLLLALVALLMPVPLWAFVLAIAWLAHVALDRACGYGLRDRAGFQRGR